MKTKFRFKNIRTRLTFWLFVVAMVPLTVSFIITYFQRVEDIKTIEFQKLTAIRDLKVNSLQNWIDERKGDVRIISEESDVTDLEFLFGKEALSSSNVESITRVRELLKNYIQFYSAYSELFVIDPRGKVRVSTSINNEGLDKTGFPYFKEPLRAGRLYIQDIYYSKELRKNAMTFSRPIFCQTHDREHIVGIVVARIDLEHDLYRMLLERSGMGETGETLIVNRDVIALNDLRWYDNAPLRLEIKAEPAIKASRGETGIVESKDYRGEPILAAYTHISDTGWGFVSKQDQRELYARINKLLRNMLIILLISILGAYFAAFMLARSFSLPLIEITETARKTEAGNLTIRSQVRSDDEFGVLAQTFNNMADSTEAHRTNQEGVNSLGEIMVATTTVVDFSEKFIKKLLEITRSAFGTFYLLNADKKSFEHVFSMGFDSEHLKTLDPRIIEGAFSNACTTKEITYINKIPKETVFKVNTIAGVALPRCIVTLPITIKGEVSAVISLGSLNDYSETDMAIFNQIQAGMSTALSNILAGEETKMLAEELSGKNQELEAQTVELQNQNMEIEAQRKQVEEANRLKSEFLSNMSHELRTPLNSVMALSQVLIRQAEDKLSEEETNYLKVIARNGKNLLALINDILDLAKIESGKMDFSAKLFSLSSAVEVIMERLEPVAEDKGIELNLQIADDLPKLESDEKRVHQILQNLIGNAVKFTTAGSVTVSARSDVENVHIEISDTGIGISGKNLPFIFEEFRQVDGTTARQYEGTGLGLSIAYKAVKALGGDLSVESILGKGSKFSLTLPVKWQRTISRPESLVPKPTAEKLPSQKTVLVVDDEPEVVTLIADYLSQAGYFTITATSGAHALELAEKHRPFAITLDVIMPEMDGFEVLQRLKENPITRNIPTIIISITDDKETGFAMGAVGYIAKPVNKDTLITEIKKIGGRSPRTIMVVDDNEFECKEMSKIINQEGMQAVVADSGTKCMRIIKKSLPDVLVLDLMMPDMDGFEVLERVRNDPSTKKLPVIVVTAKELTTEDRDKLAGNATAVLQKSDTTSRALLKEIKKILDDIGMSQKSQVSTELKTAKRVLVVEDNPVAMLQVRMVLESEGYRVDIAGGGQEALDYVKDTIPDGIILDLMMPEVDGFAVLNNIRADQTTENIPILILTAKDLTSEELKELKSNNIQQLVQKGDIPREILLHKIHLMLGESSMIEPQEKTVPIEIPIQSLRKKPRIEGKPTILVVEDNPDNMLTVKAVLQNRYNILEATDGEKGLNMALTEQLDLVLLDMSLPKMDGFTVVGKIKEENKTCHIPVIAMTAKAMKGDKEKILEAGCDDYLSKPIDPDEVLEKIDNWLVKLS